MDWAALSTVVSAVIAAIVSGIAYQLRRNDERTKILNNSLFVLLEVWHLLRISTAIQSQSFASAYVAKVRGLFPNVQITAQDEFFAQAIALLHQHVIDVFESQSQHIRAAFRASIQQLASVEPLLAFRLSGNENLKSSIDGVCLEISKLMRDMVSRAQEDLGNARVLGILDGHARGYLYRDAVADLERSLRSIALRVGPTMYLRMAIRLVRAKPSRIPLEQIVDKLVGELLVPALREVSKQTAVPKEPPAHQPSA